MQCFYLWNTGLETEFQKTSTCSHTHIHTPNLTHTPPHITAKISPWLNAAWTDQNWSKNTTYCLVATLPLHSHMYIVTLTNIFSPFHLHWTHNITITIYHATFYCMLRHRHLKYYEPCAFIYLPWYLVLFSLYWYVLSMSTKTTSCFSFLAM